MSGENATFAHSVSKCSENSGPRGFWLDLRSKRTITEKHLDEYTSESYNFYDPLLSPKVGVVDLEPPNDWIRSDWPRSWRLNLHSFRFADYWIRKYQYGGDSNNLHRLMEVSLDYLANVWHEGKKVKDLEFVCSDVSVAARAAAFSFLINQSRDAKLDRTGVELLRGALVEHFAYSADDKNYNSNNHGLFNDLHLLICLINCPEMSDAGSAAERIGARFVTTFVDRQISPEYIHMEHTPSYALLWLLIGDKAQQVFRALRSAGFSSLQEKIDSVTAAIERVRQNFWWFVRPDGSLANFGDQGQVIAPRWLQSIEGSYGYAVFPESGYGFYKSSSTYLAFVAAYHSTKVGKSGYRSSSHKQRDELSLLWSEETEPILIDTGLRAFDYGVERKYTYSKQAHNTLSVDPHDFMDAGILKYMDKTEPYGSGILAVDRVNGSDEVGVLAGEDKLLYKQGVNHVRLLLFRPGEWLIVIDCVRLKKGARAEWNFHFHERWKCQRRMVSHAQLKCGRRWLTMEMCSSRAPNSPHAYLYRGDFEPLRGWRFAGDPIPTTQLRQVEWLERKVPYTKLTAFSVGSRKSEVSDARLTSDGRIMRIELSLTTTKYQERIFQEIALKSRVLSEVFSGEVRHSIVPDRVRRT